MTKLAIAVLATLICGISTAAQPSPRAANSKLALGLPGEPWELVFDAPGFKVTINGLQPDGRAYLQAQNASTQVVLSAFLERVPGKATEQECTANQSRRLAQKVEYNRENIATKTVDGMAIAEYTIPQFRGVPVRQRNLFACLPKDDVYVDIHISKTSFEPAQEDLLNAVLNSAHFVPRTGPSESPQRPAGEPNSAANPSLGYFREGSVFFIQQKYAESIAPYQKALDAEKQTRTLPRDEWRVLVDNLGMAYGITGDLNRAEETLNYGVSQDPAYPMFYYNLACVAAGRNDENKTIELLRKAFSLKANMIPGESMPDPRSDDSFKPFLADARFRKALDSL